MQNHLETKTVSSLADLKAALDFFACAAHIADIGARLARNPNFKLSDCLTPIINLYSSHGPDSITLRLRQTILTDGSTVYDIIIG